MARGDCCAAWCTRFSSALSCVSRASSVLITDGVAYDLDYEERYAREDTRMALREAQAAGTACVCLSIGGTTSAQQLEELFGAANLLMVDDAEQWPGRIDAVCR